MAASSVDKLQQFVNQPAHYQQRWARHDTAFWLKFVLKEWNPLTTSLHARATNLHLDYIYVDLLKLVLGKKFGKLHKYVSAVLQLLQADGELGSQDGKLLEGLFGANCKEAAPWWLNLCLALHVEACEALLELLDAEEPLLMFEVPQVWSQPAEHARPFEAFLRSRWGEELPGLLDVTKTELSWWTLLPAASKPPARDCPAPRGYWVHPRGPEGVETWLQRYQPPMTQGTYKQGPPLEGIKKLLWQVFELSIPPVWSRKFHLCDSWQLTKGLTNFEALDSCPWIVTWLQAFDLSYMCLLQKASDAVIFNLHVKTLKSMLALPNAPRDLETHADFLLEPTLLLQLPWSAVLFQQWLAGALLEVTRFEALSMELKCWPMAQDVIEPTTKLLALVARCKERLLLGLALLSRDIREFPVISPNAPSIILNEVVMPAVSVLRFLLHGQAYPILHQLKQRAFSQNSDLTTFPKSHRCIDPRALFLDKRLLFFHVAHYFHVFYWMRNTVPQPFSISDSEKLNDLLKDFMKQRLHLIRYEPYKPVHFEPVGSEVFREACRINNRDIFAVICNPFLLILLDNRAALIGEGYHTKAMEISPSNRDKARERRAWMQRHSSLFTEVGEFATSVRAEPPSLLGCLVASTAEALVREHEVRCDLLDALIRDKPVHVPPSAGQDPPFDLEQIHAALDLATKEFVSATGEHLQTLFPPQWLEKHTPHQFQNTFEIGRSKKLFCQNFDMLSGKSMVRNFSLLQEYKYRLDPDLVLVRTYLDYALSLRFCNRALQSVENKETTVEQKLARNFIVETFKDQFKTISVPSEKVEPCQIREPFYVTPAIEECEVIVRTFTLRQDNSTNFLVGLASKCGVSVESYVQSMREWLSCIDQLLCYNLANILLCVGANKTFFTSCPTDEISYVAALTVADNFTLEAENPLIKMMLIRETINVFINIVAALAEMNPHIKNLKHTKLLLHIQPALLKVKTALVSCFVTQYSSADCTAIPFERFKLLSQLRTLYSYILELVLAIRRTIPGEKKDSFWFLIRKLEFKSDFADLFLDWSKDCAIFEKLGLSRSSPEQAEQYLEKLPSIVEAQEGEETLDLDPERFFDIQACAFCKKFTERVRGLVKEEEEFFCSEQCADARQEKSTQEGHCEQNGGEAARIRLIREKIDALERYRHEMQTRREEKAKERQCEQCDGVETAERTFYSEKFCTKECQVQWNKECRCCKKPVTPELRLVGTVLLCGARCQVHWIQEQQADWKKKRCGLCRRSREGSEGFLPCGGRVFCGAHCRDGWRANGGRPYESGLLDCSYCGKRERKDEQFSLCPACVSDPQFPRPEVYCSEECRQLWWDLEHQAQHLESERKVGDYCTTQ